MSFVWREHTGEFNGSLTSTSRNPRYLEIPANTLAAATTYEFSLVAFMTDTPQINNTAEVIYI